MIVSRIVSRIVSNIVRRGVLYRYRVSYDTETRIRRRVYGECYRWIRSMDTRYTVCIDLEQRHLLGF